MDGLMDTDIGGQIYRTVYFFYFKFLNFFIQTVVAYAP